MSVAHVKTRERKKNHSNTAVLSPKTGDNASPVNSAGPGQTRQSHTGSLGAFYASGPVIGLPLPVQRKVVIGRANDPYEREADSVADRVTAGQNVPFVSRITPGSLGAPGHAAPAQRKEEEEKEEEPVQEEALQKQEEEKEEEPVQEMAIQRQEEEKEEEPVQEMAIQRQEEEKEEEPVQEMAIQRQEEEEEEEEKEEEPVQSKAASSGPNASSAMSSAAAGAIRTKGPGEPMKPSTRHTLESRMGTDLSDVRVHSGNSAGESAGTLKAKAFTHKQHIWLGRGQSQDDLHLMAHETSHVLQQDGVVRKKPIIQRAPEDEGIKEEEEKPEEKEEEPTPAVKPKKPPAEETKKAEEKKPPEVEKKSPKGVEGKKPEAAPVPVKETLAAKEEAPGKKEEKEKEKETKPGETAGKAGEKSAVEGAAKEEETKEEEPAAVEAESAPSSGGGGPAAESAVEGAAAGAEGGEKAPEEAGKEGEEKPKEGKEEKAAEETPSPESDPRFQGVIKRLDKNAEQEKTHEPAEKKVADAQAAALPPENDRSSRAQAAQVDVMDEQEAEKPDTDSFLNMLRAELERVAPKSMEETEEFKKKGKAGELKNNLTSKVGEQKEQAAGDIKAAAETEPDPNSVEPKEVVEMPPDPADPKKVNLRSKDVLPVPKKEEDISVEENTQKADQLMAENDIDQEQLEKANEPQFDDAIKSKKELEEHAAQVPETYREEEQAVVKEGEADVESKEKDAKDQMQKEREKAKNDVIGKQDETKKKEEEERKKVAGDIQAMYDETKKKVEDKLTTLDEDVNRLFDEGEKKARDNFETYVDDRMSDYKWDRYISRIGGGLLWAKDKLFGMPDEVNRFYEEGRDLYIKEMDTVLVAIAGHVETVLKEAKDEIAAGKVKIAEYVESLPETLKKAGEDAQTNMNDKFEELEQGVEDKKQQLAQQMAQKYNEAREKLDARIEELKAANKGLVDAFIGKIMEIIKMLKEFKERVMGLLGQAGDSVRKIVKDPIGFLKNLLSAVKKGFNQFSDNILTHLKKGLMGWLFGTMSKAGVEVPKDFSLKSIFGLVMQVLGITPDRIRLELGKMIGEKNVERIEKAWGMVSTFMSGGVAGLWKEVREYIGDLKGMVIGEIRNWLIIQVVKQAVLWVVSLFNPASALLKAIKLIYDVIMFFVENIERIMQLVEAVVQSVSKIVAGQVGDAANWIENAMGRTIPIIISFLARLLGLGGISKKIRSFIKKVQKKVWKAIKNFLKKIKGKIKGFFGKGKKSKKSSKPSTKDERERERKKKAAVGDVKNAMAKGIRRSKLKTLLKSVKKKYELKSAALDAKNDVLIKNSDPEKIPGDIVEEEMRVTKPDDKERRKKVKEGGDLVGTFSASAPSVNTVRGVLEPHVEGFPYTEMPTSARRPTEAKADIYGKVDGIDRVAGSKGLKNVNEFGNIEMRLKGRTISDYESGHLVANEFGGNDNFENLVPQRGDYVNRGVYRSIEKWVRTQIPNLPDSDKSKQKAALTMKVNPSYGGDITLTVAQAAKALSLRLESRYRAAGGVVKKAEKRVAEAAPGTEKKEKAERYLTYGEGLLRGAEEAKGRGEAYEASAAASTESVTIPARIPKGIKVNVTFETEVDEKGEMTAESKQKAAFDDKKKNVGKVSSKDPIIIKEPTPKGKKDTAAEENTGSKPKTKTVKAQKSFDVKE